MNEEERSGDEMGKQGNDAEGGKEGERKGGSDMTE